MGVRGAGMDPNAGIKQVHFNDKQKREQKETWSRGVMHKTKIRD